MLGMCEDGLCGHWYVLGLIATNTWCKIGHCSSVAVNPLSGVKSEPTVGYLANPPFWTISIFSSPKWGPPLAKDHRLYTRMLINLFDSYTLWYRLLGNKQVENEFRRCLFKHRHAACMHTIDIDSSSLEKNLKIPSAKCWPLCSALKFVLKWISRKTSRTMIRLFLWYWWICLFTALTLCAY